MSYRKINYKAHVEVNVLTIFIIAKKMFIKGLNCSMMISLFNHSLTSHVHYGCAIKSWNLDVAVDKTNLKIVFVPAFGPACILNGRIQYALLIPIEMHELKHRYDGFFYQCKYCNDHSFIILQYDSSNSDLHLMKLIKYLLKKLATYESRKRKFPLYVDIVLQNDLGLLVRPMLYSDIRWMF